MAIVPPGNRSGFTGSDVRLRRARQAASMALLGMLAACSGGGGSGGGYAGSGGYSAPGGDGDPWGPYISEASQRFSVPEPWIRAVMHQESGGHQYLGGKLTTSSAGAAGLMQVMPGTYDGLRRRYGLGSDPYDPHDNIMAGTAYLKEMYDRYGSQKLLLAAYNAGPGRVDSYLNSGRSLPTETVNYVAAITPNMNRAGPSNYAVAMARSPANVTVMARMAPIASPGDPGMPMPEGGPVQMASAGMAPIASPGDPGMPAADGGPIQMASMAPIVSPGDRGAMAPIASPGDPGIPAIVAAVAKAPLGTPVANLPAKPQTAFTQYQNGQYRDDGGRLRSPQPGFLHIPTTRSTAIAPPPSPVETVAYRTPNGGGAGYTIQVGAYASPGEARNAAEAARGLAGTASARTELGTAKRPDGSVLFRARLTGLSSAEASGACQRLNASHRPCFVVPADGTS